jgi:hypothetical protein
MSGRRNGSLGLETRIISIRRSAGDVFTYLAVEITETSMNSGIRS